MQYGDDCVVLVVDVDLVLVKNCDVPGFCKFYSADERRLHDAGCDVDVMRWAAHRCGKVSNFAGVFGGAIGHAENLV